MNVKDLLKIDELKILTNELNLYKNISDFYAGDLLSFVLGHVKEKNTVLLTICNSLNVIAVATLLDMSAIIFCEGVKPLQSVIDKAIGENIVLFTTELSSLKIAKVINESIL